MTCQCDHCGTLRRYPASLPAVYAQCARCTFRTLHYRIILTSDAAYP